MSSPSRIESDLYVNGSLSSKTFTAAAGSITNASVAASAGIAATKLQQQKTITYAQANSAITDITTAIHTAYGATGTVVAFEAGSIVAATGNATATVDLKKNGTTVLSAVITLDSSNTAYVAEAGTVSSASYVDGDVFTIVTVGTVGTGALPTGFFCSMTIREDPQ